MLTTCQVEALPFEAMQNHSSKQAQAEQNKEVALALAPGSCFVLVERVRQGIPTIYGVYKLVEFSLSEDRLAWKVEIAGDKILEEKTGVMFLHEEFLTMRPAQPITMHTTENGLSVVFKFHLPRNCMLHHLDYFMKLLPTHVNPTIAG